jgi:hypothetical protein
VPLSPRAPRQRASARVETAHSRPVLHCAALFFLDLVVGLAKAHIAECVLHSMKM